MQLWIVRVRPSVRGGGVRGRWVRRQLWDMRRNAGAVSSGVLRVHPRLCRDRCGIPEAGARPTRPGQRVPSLRQPWEANQRAPKEARAGPHRHGRAQ